MAFPPDPRVDEAKAKDVELLIKRLQLPNMRRRSSEWVGPCPNCGGNDRFNVNHNTGQFLCHQCDMKGGDQIALVMECENKSFPKALTWLCGDRPADPAEAARREKRAAQDKAKSADTAERKRQQAIAGALEIWRAGITAEDSPVRGYLERRGLTRALLPQIPPSIRFHPDLRYMEHSKAQGGWVEIHRGPAMLGKMVQPDGTFGGVHRTWLDLDQPKGKIVIPREVEFAGKPGEIFDAKKTLGSKKGGTIRLHLVPRGADLPGTDTMVVGEGIETTLTAMVSGVFPGASFICGIDLGNMAGARIAVPMPGRKRPSKRLSTIPDMADSRAFVPPEWVDVLVYIKDGDSDPEFTQAQLVAGLQRAMKLRPGLRSRIWAAPAGMDLNDKLMGAQK